MNTIFCSSLNVMQKSIMLIVLFVAGINIRAGATINVAKASASICTNLASTGPAQGWTTLNTITIHEQNSDFGNTAGSWSVSIVLAAPTGWQFKSTVIPTVGFSAGQDVTSVSVGAFTSTSLTININGTNKTHNDNVTIAGLQVQPISTSASTGNIVPSSITGIANGLTASSIFATLAPALPGAGSVGVTVSSSPSNAICSGTSVTFTASVTKGGPTPAYQWKLNGSNISGATGSTYSSSSLANGNTIVCSVISSSCISSPTATSATQTMTVSAPPSAISGANSVCTGNTVTYTNTTPGGTWSSSNTDVASVDPSTGAILPVNTGTATITYSTGTGCAATKIITVNATPASITGTGTVCPGLITDLNSSTGGGTWSSSATSVATVNSGDGKVTGVAAGTATITLTGANGCITTSVVTVNAMPGNLTGSTVCTGSTTTLTNSVAGGTWASGNTARATIGTSTGIVTGVTQGNATITYTLAGGCSKTAVVTVNNTPAAITSVGVPSVCTSGTIQLNDATGGGTWASSNTSIGTVNSNGKVNGAAQGTTTISYSLNNGCRATVVVTVATTPAAIGGIAGLCSGVPTTLTNTSLYGTWSSSNTTVATVSAAGVVTGGTSGTATITYNTGCGSAVTKVVTVSNSPITGTMKICTGYTTTLADASAGGTWSSGNTSIATVGSTTGVVSGVSNGTATISYINGVCTATAVVTVNVAPTAITGTTSVCQGSTVTLSNSIPYGSWTSGNGGVATIGSADGIVTGLAAGTTIITYNTGCGASTTATVTVNVLPSTISGVSEICAGSTATLSSSSGGTWSSGNMGIATVDVSTGVVSGVTAGTSTITYALPTGCLATGVVTVDAVPSANVGTASVCPGNTTMLTNYTGSGTWTSTNTGVATIGTTGSVTGVAAGTATMSYTLSTGCAAVTVVTVNPLPSAITGTATVCPAMTTVLGGSPSGGTWTSSISGAATVNSSTGEVTGVSAGTSNISYILSTGCKVGKQVTVNAAPSAISGTGTTCVGSTTTLTDAGGGTWTSANSSVATIGSSNGVVSGVASGTAAVTYTISTGCTATTSVTINTIPSAGVISGPSTVCDNGVTALSSTADGGTWTVSDSNIVDIDPVSGEAFGLTAGTVTVSYTVTNECGSSFTTSTLTVVDTPVVNVTSGTAAMCQGAAVTLSNTTPGGVWSSANGTVATVSASGVVSGMAAGTAIISYTVSNACGSVAATKVVTVNALPSAPGGTAAVCAGATTTLTNAGGGTWASSNGNVTVGTASGVVTGVTAGTSTITYTLSTGCASTTLVTVNALPAAIGGAPAVCEGATTNLNDATTGGTWSSSNGNATVGAASGVVTGVTAGNSTITYTLSTGCIATKAVTVNVQPAAITGIAVVCEGAATTLNNVVTGGAWSSSNTAVATIDAATGVVSGVAAGTAAITFATSGGCSSMTTLTVNAMPAAVTGTSVVCGGSSVVLNNTTSGGVWSSGTSSVATVNATGVVTGVASGVAMITYAMPTGCQVSYPVTVNAAPMPILGDNTLCLGVSTLYYADSTAGGTWSTADASVATIASTGGLTGVAVGATTVSYTVASGCFVTTPVTVTAAVAPITGVATACVGATTALGSSTTGGVWSSKIPAYATIDSNTGVVTGVQAGAIPMTYSLGSSCYTVRSVTVNPLPGAIGGVNWVCAGSTTSISNSTPGGTWSSGDAGIATTSLLNPIWTSVAGVAAGTASITYTLPTGCYRAKDVTVNPVAPISGPSTICLSEPTTLTNTIGGGTWLSSNPSWATIGYTTGVVNGLSGASVTITYYSPTGCMSTLPVTISRTSVVSGPTSACVGNTITLTNAIAGGTWSSSDMSVAAASGTTGVITGISNGIAVITYTNAAGCGKTQTVTVNPSPAAIAGADAVCAGTTVALGDTVAGGSWTSSIPAIASVDAAGVVTGISANHTIAISYTLPSGCLASKVVSVLATPAAISGAAVICQGTTSNYTNGLSGGSWSSSDETIATISATGVVTAVGSGAVVITYAMPTGCLQTKVLTVNAISPVTGDSVVCVASTATVANAMAGGTWLSNAIARATITSDGVIAGVAAGTAVITYTNPAGCRATRLVTVGAQPSITGSALACSGLTATLTSSVTGGSWSSSNTAIADVDAVTGVVTGNTPGSATVTYMTSVGCAASKVVTINAYPSAISGASIVCTGSTITLANTVSGGTWSSTATGVATVSAAGEVAGIAAGTTNISYVTGAGCVVGRTITVNPISPITGTASACLGMATTLSCASTGGTWSSGNTAIAPITSGGVVTGVSSGTTVITYMIPSGCARTVVVSVNPAATAITGATSLCAGFPSTLAGNVGGGTWISSNAAIASVGSANGVVTGVASGTAMITYTSGLNCRIATMVSVNSSAAITGTLKVCAGSITSLANATTGGVWITSTPSVASIDAASGVVTGVAAGTSLITYSPATGCGRTAVVTVNPVPAAIVGSLNACVGSTSLVTDPTSGGVSFTSSNPSIASVGTTSGVVTGVAAGTAMITYTINTGCVSTAVFTVNSLPPTIDGPMFACMGSSTTLSNSAAGGTWASSNTGRANVGLTTGVVTGITAGTFNVTYTLSTGCKAMATVTVNPTSAITGASSVNAGAMITLSDATTGGIWSSSDGSTATVDASAGIVSGVTGGPVTITYTTAAGCPRTTTVTVNAVGGRAAESTEMSTQAVQVDLYPNPTNGTFTIKTQRAGILSVFGIDGKEAGHYSIAEGVTPVQLQQGLATGVYMCRFTDVNNNTTIIRLVYQP